MRFLGIPGSLRRDSLNALVMETLPALAPASVEICAYRDVGSLPLYNEDLDGAEPPIEVERFRDAVRDADALLWVTPEYNHSVPAVIKNAIDWTSHPISRAALVGRCSAIIVATQGRGGFRGMADLARMLRDLGGYVVPAPEVCVQFAHTKLVRDESGTARHVDEMTVGLIQVLLASLARAVTEDLGDTVGRCWSDVEAYAASRRTVP